MKPLAKGLLIGCGLLVLIGVLVVGAVAWYVSEHGDELMAQGKAVEEEGRRAGVGATGQSCVDGGLDLFKRKGGITGGVQARIWMQACLESSHPGAEFCADVPHETEFARSVTWRMHQCEAKGLGNDSACASVVSGIQRYCDERAGASR